MALIKCASALLENIRLGWMWLAVTNTLAYYGTEFVTAMKRFTGHGLALSCFVSSILVDRCYKTFSFVNDTEAK